MLHIIIYLSSLIALIWIIKYWRKVVAKTKGKNIVVLGTKGVGKTTLQMFLRTGEISANQFATNRDYLPKKKLKLKDLELKISKGDDIGGTKDHYTEWKELFSQSDICIYLFDANKVNNNEQHHINLIQTELRMIFKKWFNDEHKNIKKHFYIIGLFCDKIKGINVKDRNQMQDLREDILQRLKLVKHNVDINSSKILLGSMENKENSELLVTEFLTLETNTKD